MVTDGRTCSIFQGLGGRLPWKLVIICQQQNNATAWSMNDLCSSRHRSTYNTTTCVLYGPTVANRHNNVVYTSQLFDCIHINRAAEDIG